MSQYIRKLASGLNVQPLLWALRQNPHLWDQVTGRTAPPDSPHRDINDIWVRYAPPGQVKVPGPHHSVWYPAADSLPVGPLCKSIMARVGGERLGGVLITQVPPGKRVHPHSDDGWHARYYEKFAVQVESAPGQAFCFEDGKLETAPGDLYWFDNSVTHWVENPTPYNRITLIVCVRPMEV